MKLELILALVLMKLTIGERQQRLTRVTDQSERISDDDNFYNFDGRKSVNYSDGLRDKNQIGEKPSQLKLRRNSICSSHVNDTQKNENGNSYLLETEGNRLERLMELNSYDCTNDQCHPEKIPLIPSGGVEKKIRRKRSRTRKKQKFKQAFNGDDYMDEDEEEINYRKRIRKRKRKKRYWNNWTQWSPCSVTCGRGRKIRWRKCIARNCATGELEMGEKTCQLPACNLLSKLLGL